MLLMSEPKKKPKVADRHKPAVQVRVPGNLAKLLQEVADAEVDSSVAEQTKLAIRFYLRHKGKLEG